MARRRDIDRLAELEELFADLWQVPRFAAGMRLTHRPQIDVFRTENPPALTLVVEIPGANPDAFRIVLDGRRLMIAGQRDRPRVDGRWFRSEIEYGPFEREVSLAFDVNVDEVNASYERGLLRIVLPVAEQPPAPVRVSIEVLRTR
jgi:HSP20 family protein